MRDHYDMVLDCESDESGLTEQEVFFVADMGDKIEDGQPMTRKQIEKLEAIWTKVTGGII